MININPEFSGQSEFPDDDSWDAHQMNEWGEKMIRALTPPISDGTVLDELISREEAERDIEVIKKLEKRSV
jgi:hypothetical protein